MYFGIVLFTERHALLYYYNWKNTILSYLIFSVIPIGKEQRSLSCHGRALILRICLGINIYLSYKHTYMYIYVCVLQFIFTFSIPPSQNLSATHLLTSPDGSRYLLENSNGLKIKYVHLLVYITQCNTKIVNAIWTSFAKSAHRN